MMFEFFALKIDILLQKETKNIVFQDMSKDTEKNTCLHIFIVLPLSYMESLKAANSM